MIFTKLSNPWAWNTRADEEYTEHMNRAYQIGLAQGELKGRMELANELLEGEDLNIVRLRQVH